ncbi:MAG TPA: hypothetical protein DCX46_13580 [Bacteroidetes bacterium]|nr:MAG: hypothetical protein A2X68_07010 [Ignavibacteria bacterium GWC2_56_12]HAV24489.1 hypothetical protein [Bacteroidota bacterium]
MSRSVSSSIEVSAHPFRALHAFVDLDMMRSWWRVERGLVQPRAGGVWALAWERTDAGFRYFESGIVKVYTPGAELVVDNVVYFNPEHPVFGPMRLRVLVRASDGGSVIHVTQDGYGDGAEWDWYYEAVRQAWPATLGLLKQWLEEHPE